MPLPDIFCPTCHRFVGDKDKCRYCDWVRPAQSLAYTRRHHDLKIPFLGVSDVT